MNELRTEKKVNLEILSDKRVEVLLITIYFLGDKELTRENFRFCCLFNVIYLFTGLVVSNLFFGTVDE